MKYSEYQVDDFVTNEFFVRWVRSPDEETDHFWRRWLANYPEKHDTVSEARQLVMSIHYGQRFEMTDAQYVQLFERIVSPAPVKAVVQPPVKRRWLDGKWVNYAAAALVPALLAVLYWYGQWGKGTEAKNAKASAQIIEKFNPNGQRSSIKLGDGSIIKLNSDSKLRFPERFSDSLRVVYLDGEAFFEVAKDSGRPFVVVANGLQIKVLGTQFNVETTPEQTAVSLLEGGVEVDDQQGNRLRLAPLEQLDYHPESNEMVKKPFDPEEVLAWTENRLVFSDAKYPEVFQELEKWYGVEIEWADIRPQGRYSGAYINAPLTEVLDGVCLASGFRYQLQGRKVTIW